MALSCPNCGRQFDVTLFEFGRSVACECGEIIALQTGQMVRVKVEDVARKRRDADTEEESPHA